MAKSKMMCLLFTFLGVVFSGLGVPLILEMVGRNSAYGFRTEKTMSSDAIWFEANRVAGWGMLIAGIIMIVVSLVLYRRDYSVGRVAAWNLVAMVGSLGITLGYSAYALSQM